MSLLLSSGLVVSDFFVAGELCAKNKILIAIANPACSATTATSKTLEVLTSVADSTGYLSSYQQIPLNLKTSKRYSQIPEQKHSRNHEPNPNKRIIQRGQRTPTNQRNRYPRDIRIPIQRPALEQIRAFRATPLQHSPQTQWQQKRIAIHQARGAGQQCKVVVKMRLADRGEVCGDSAGEEEDDDDGGRDPEGPVEVRVAVEDVEEVGAWVQCV